jgi:acetyl esterase/lipase
MSWHDHHSPFPPWRNTLADKEQGFKAYAVHQLKLVGESEGRGDVRKKIDTEKMAHEGAEVSGSTISLQKPTLWFTLWSVVILASVSGHVFTTGAVEKQAVIVEEGLLYGKGGDAELKLDLARPPRGDGAFPALVFLFSGGYQTGSRSDWYAVLKEAATRGYVAVAIDYRLTSVLENGHPKYPFPAQVHDGKCAVRWLRAHAKTYHLDPNRVGVVGFSAGGHLALLLGLTDASDGLEGNCGDRRMSSRVQAVVNLAGSTDVMRHYQIRPSTYGDLLGGTPEQVPERYKMASPLTYVSQDDPPVLSLCGTDDPVLPQEELLDEKLKTVGVSHTLIVREGVGHALSGLVNFWEDNPVWDFLEKHLKKGKR